jgi:FkbM family methyltransferase
MTSKLPFSINLPSGPFEFREISDIPTFWQIFFADLYSVRPTDRIIIDAGANIGAFTLYALLTNHKCHVVSVEPAPDTCDRLRALVSSHGVSSRCTIVEAALSSETGITTIQMCQGSQFRRTGKEGIPVSSTTLDDLVAPYDRVDLLKLDTQGAEYPALLTASPDILQRIRRIEMEYHPFGDVHELLRLLTERGFSLDDCRPNSNAPGYGMARLSRSD